MCNAMLNNPARSFKASPMPMAFPYRATHHGHAGFLTLGPSLVRSVPAVWRFLGPNRSG